jgi:site-specific recombinase XerD
MNRSKKIIEYLDDYLLYIDIERGLSVKTQESYGRFLEVFFRWLRENKFDNVKPKDLDADLVWNYRVYLSRHIDLKTRQGLKKATQNYYLIALRSLLDFFVTKKIDSLSPAEIKLARNKSDKEVYTLKVEEVERLLLSPNIKNKIGLRDRAILESLFSTGLRVAELVSLDRSQVQVSVKVSDLEVAITGKGGHVRAVYFSQRANGWLQKYLKTRLDSDKALFVNYKPGKIEPGKSRRLTTRSVENIVKKYVKISGLPSVITPHTLRHTFATDLLSHGADLRLVQEFLGHKNIATTQIYTHVTNKELKDMHRKVHGKRRI